jgi:hypothetical protein
MEQRIKETEKKEEAVAPAAAALATADSPAAAKPSRKKNRVLHLLGWTDQAIRRSSTILQARER